MTEATFDAPRDDLVRHVPFTLERADNADGLTLTGHGAVFNTWTEIDSWEGRFKERIAPGAFKKTIRENGSRVKLQFDHGQHPLIGSLPIGAIRDLSEDGIGLFVEARLADNWLVQPVRDAIENESIDGMSFRFTVEKEKWDKVDSDLPERTITEVRLVEVGPVVWPAYDQTDVGVRSLELARSLMNADDTVRRDIARVLLTRDERGAFYDDLRQQLKSLLVERFPEGPGRWLWIRDFSDDEVIFDLDGYDEPGTFRLAYSTDDDTVVLTEDDPEKVVPKTTYTPARGDDPATQPGAAEGTPTRAGEDTEPPPGHSGTYTPAARPFPGDDDRAAVIARIRAAACA